MKLRGDNKVKGDGTFHEVKEEHNKVRETIHSFMFNNDNAIPIIYTLFPNRLCKKKDIYIYINMCVCIYIYIVLYEEGEARGAVSPTVNFFLIFFIALCQQYQPWESGLIILVNMV